MAQALLTRTQFTVEPGRQEVIIRSVFNAPREQVFKAMTDRNLVPTWWGPSSLTTRVDKMEVRPGGEWRYVQKDAQGKEYAFRGVYHDVTQNERLIYTFQWEEMPGVVNLETITFRDLDGKTEVVDHVVFQSVEGRDGMFKMGMEKGSRESMERFAVLVEKP
jgi:uncharacterized protein YndB with AHSA1/START domain